MVLTVDLEINIVLQMIRQETHTAFQRHQLRAHRHQADFFLRQTACTAFRVAFGINFK